MIQINYNSPAPFQQDNKTISPRSLPKKKFTEEDDAKLIQIVQRLGTKSWTEISKAMGDRNQRQCKERWENYLNPEINNNPWTKEEDNLLIQKQLEIGSKWVTIARFFYHRTDAAVKNRWQMLARKQKKMLSMAKTQTIFESPKIMRPSSQIAQQSIKLENKNEIFVIEKPTNCTDMCPNLIEDDECCYWDLNFQEADLSYQEMSF